jgi:hypothetical protein
MGSKERNQSMGGQGIHRKKGCQVQQIPQAGRGKFQWPGPENILGQREENRSIPSGLKNMYSTFRQAIIEKINSSDLDGIAQAYRTDRSSIAKFPAALVFPTESSAEYFETAPGSNKETYNFTVRVIHPFVEGQEKADLAIEKALDQLITVFRDRNALGPGVADWVTPVPSIWGYQDRGTGQARIGEIRLSVVKHVGIT